VLLALAVAFGPAQRPGTSRSRRAAVLGCATGISWGFVAAVIKELSSHLGDGVGAIASSWSLYVLIVVGAATTLLAAHALAAGPLAASQPGFTILDPFSASMLGLFLFGEHIQAGIADLAGEAAALAVVIGGVSALSHSHLIVGEHGTLHGPPSRILAAQPPRTGRPMTGTSRADRHPRRTHRRPPPVQPASPAPHPAAADTCSPHRSQRDHPASDLMLNHVRLDRAAADPACRQLPSQHPG
jgi:hypothetical protein